VRVDLLVDDEWEPRTSFEPPGTFELDTTGLNDGPHKLIIRAQEDDGSVGLEEIPFTVRNGPGIAVVGIRDGEVVRGRIPILVNAFQSRAGDEFEPTYAETPAPIPTWAWVLCLVVAAWAMYYVTDQYRSVADELAAAAPLAAAATDVEATGDVSAIEDSDWVALGAQVYGNYCAACHQQSGEGLPGVFPPLRGDPVVTAPGAEVHVLTVLNGLQGKIIGGVAYASPMPAFGTQLSDEEIAAVVNHERKSWGNRAPITTVAEVAGLRR
jgi:mono/diheme cytochrome c family protein